MKKLFLILGIIGLLCSCNKRVYKDIEGRLVEVVSDNGRLRYIEFDDHEYVLFKHHYHGSVCHSPKCSCLSKD